MSDLFRLIATLPPYVDHRRAIIDHPAVHELRFNTVSPLAETRAEVLARLQQECGGKRLWIDLKGRQLRIAEFAYLPDAYVTLTHRIKLELPATAIFRDGTASIQRLVDGNKLILGERPPRVVGQGEPINILDGDLEVEGYLTDSDREYVAAAASLGLHDYMLSFAERDSDVADVLAIDPKARCVAKVESEEGLAWMQVRKPKVGLMAARDDLFVNMGDMPWLMIAALKSIMECDPGAIAASHLFESLCDGKGPTMNEIADVELLLRMGYRTLMFSDTLCFRREPFRKAAGLMLDLMRHREEWA